MARLSASQKRNIRIALGVADELKASPRVRKAMVETMGVEANYGNPNHGDRDSLGAFQQRPSQGWGSPEQVRDVRYAAKQFLKRAIEANKSHEGTAGTLAQRVQRSGFPDRYDQRSEEAESILKGLTGRSSGSRKSSTRQETVSPGIDNSQARAQAVANYFARTGGKLGGIANLTAVGQELQGLKDVAPVTRTVTQASAGSGGHSYSDGHNHAPGSLKPGGGYAGTKRPADTLRKIGEDLGLQVTSSKRHNSNPYSGSRSDHDHGNKDAYAYDLSNGSKPTPEMDRAAFRIARRLGIKDYKMGQPIMRSVTLNGYRYQVIYRGDGPEFGGNHLNHVHVGVKKV